MSRRIGIGPSTVLAAICAAVLIMAMAVPDLGRYAVLVLVLADPVWLVTQRPRARSPLLAGLD